MVDGDEADPEDVAEEEDDEEGEPLLEAFADEGVEAEEAVEAEFLQDAGVEHGDGGGGSGVGGCGPRSGRERGRRGCRSR